MELERIFRISKNLEGIKAYIIYFEGIRTDSKLLKKFDGWIPRIGLIPLTNELIIDLKALSLSDKTIKDLEDQMEVMNSLLDEVDQFKSNEDPSQVEGFSEWEKRETSFRNNINSLIPIWQDRIVSELSKRKVKELYANTLVNPAKLVRGASSFFDEKLWSKMTNLQKDDLNDGCKCILLEAWTPAAMIIMRTIESGLRTYHERITKEDPSGKNWGTILKDLTRHPSADKKILNYFDYLKDYRNQIQHPEARFDQSETEDMLNQAIHIFNRIFS